ncbi:MAG: hypothetical protein AAFZ15_24825 [Bacteroidota bacterium]
MSITIISAIIAIAIVTIITFSIGFRLISFGINIGMNVINSIARAISGIWFIIIIIALIAIIQFPEIIATIGNIIEILFK